MKEEQFYPGQMSESRQQEPMSSIMKKQDNSQEVSQDGDDSIGLGSKDNQKRYRRPAGEITRKYQCWCGKAYGSENSLNQHKKLKQHFNE